MTVWRRNTALSDPGGGEPPLLGSFLDGEDGVEGLRPLNLHRAPVWHPGLIHEEGDRDPITFAVPAGGGNPHSNGARSLIHNELRLVPMLLHDLFAARRVRGKVQEWLPGILADTAGQSHRCGKALEEHEAHWSILAVGNVPREDPI
jgi:hypothetical protein